MKRALVLQTLARCLLLGFGCLSGVATAYTLSFSPGAQSVALGSQAFVAVRIAGILPDPPTTSGELDGLGDYDFDLSYDQAIIRYAGANDGFSLGWAVGLGVVDEPGRLNFSDFSWEPVPSDLLAMQSDEMLSFTLVFDSLAPGTTLLEFKPDKKDITLGSVEGKPRTPTPSTGSITVLAAVLPEPGTLALLAGAVLIVIGRHLHRA